MKITSKGQVTIPQHIRERLGLLPGAEVEFEIDGDEVRLRRAPDDMGRGRRLVEHMRGRLRGGMSTDELMALTRGPFDDGEAPA
ncbi:MAG TPA: AbrB/MazE/SpoVT family DNA-binding domain-containing protein [Gemmatimonadaceae bacterium]|nr:AbrB/MazE/SpoVT family DNA-binding domain-containing protein [Gemmatimonadaceae bacterium]